MCDVKKFKNYQVDTYYDDAGNKSFIEISCRTFGEFLNQVLNVLANYDDADIIEYDVDDGYSEFLDNYDYRHCSINFKTTKIHDIWVKPTCEADENNKISMIAYDFCNAFNDAKTHDDKVNVVIDYIYKF